jgi:hypothetical protein
LPDKLNIVMKSNADKLMLPVWRDWFTFPHEQFTAYFRRLRAVPIYDYWSIPLRASFNSDTHSAWCDHSASDRQNFLDRVGELINPLNLR